MLESATTAPYAMLAAESEPLREIIVILRRPRSAVRAYAGNLPGRNTPPQAHRHLAAVLFGESVCRCRPCHRRRNKRDICRGSLFVFRLPNYDRKGPELTVSRSVAPARREACPDGD